MRERELGGCAGEHRPGGAPAVGAAIATFGRKGWRKCGGNAQNGKTRKFLHKVVREKGSNGGRLRAESAGKTEEKRRRVRIARSRRWLPEGHMENKSFERETKTVLAWTGHLKHRRLKPSLVPLTKKSLRKKRGVSITCRRRNTRRIRSAEATPSNRKSFHHRNRPRCQTQSGKKRKHNRGNRKKKKEALSKTIAKLARMASERPQTGSAK